MTLDELREVRPDLGLAVYAFEPGGDVTLEIHFEGEIFPFQAPTVAGAIEAAFPMSGETTDVAGQAEEVQDADDIFQ